MQNIIYGVKIYETTYAMIIKLNVNAVIIKWIITIGIKRKMIIVRNVPQ